MGQRCLPDVEAGWVASMQPKSRLGESAHLRLALGEVYTRGVSVDWSAYEGGRTHQKVLLPTYPFERSSHWIDSAVLEASAAVAGAVGPVPVQETVPAAPSVSASAVLERLQAQHGLGLAGVDLSTNKNSKNFRRMFYEEICGK